MPTKPGEFTESERRKCYELIELGVPIAEVSRRSRVSRQTIYYWLEKEAPQLRSPGSSTTEANDQPCDETTNQDDRTGSDSTSVAMTTSGDKAS